MSYYLNSVSVFTGESQGKDEYLEMRIQQEMQIFAEYAAQRFAKIHFGCGFEGRAKNFRDVVLKNDGNLVDTRPGFFLQDEFQRRISLIDFDRLENSARCPTSERNVQANLEFLGNFMFPGGVRAVWPGAFGTKTEGQVSESDTDTAHRLGLDCALMPIILFNIKKKDGLGAYRHHVEDLEETLENQPYLEAKRNIIRVVDNAHDAITLIEAYDELGYVSARDLDQYIPVVDGHPVTDLEFDGELHRLKHSQMSLDLV